MPLLGTSLWALDVVFSFLFLVAVMVAMSITSVGGGFRCCCSKNKIYSAIDEKMSKSKIRILL